MLIGILSKNVKQVRERETEIWKFLGWCYTSDRPSEKQINRCKDYKAMRHDEILYLDANKMRRKINEMRPLGSW